jgi:hypothetical protein
MENSMPDSDKPQKDDRPSPPAPKKDKPDTPADREGQTREPGYDEA